MEYWPTKAQIIQIEQDQRRIGLVKPVDVGICGDAKLATQHIYSQLKDGQFQAAKTKVSLKTLLLRHPCLCFWLLLTWSIPIPPPFLLV